MRYNILITAFCLLLSLSAKATDTNENKGFRIEIDAPDKKGSTIYLVKYWNGGTYAHDSLTISEQGKALFFSTEKLPEGQYLIYIKPDLQLEFLIGDEQSDIRISIDASNPQNSKITGSKDSELLWKHIAYLNSKRLEQNKLEEQAEDTAATAEQRKAAELKLKALDEAVIAYTKGIVNKHKNGWFGKFLKGSNPITLPYNPPQTAEEVQANRKYGKDHFFDNIDLTDPRFWHTAYFTSYIDSYMEQWVEQYPDSLAAATSRLVAKAKGNEFTFKQMLTRLTNQSIESQIMGHENIWAKLAEDYIFHKNISWIDSLQLDELKKGYAKIQHNRIGMDGKSLTLQTIDGKTINTGDIAANYLVLYFYDTSCSHCQKETPLMHDKLYSKYKEKGIEIVAINIGASKDEWNKFVKEYKLNDWINANDPEFKSQYWMYYDTSAIPSIFVLDKNKKIVAKKIDEQNLDKFFEYYTK